MIKQNNYKDSPKLPVPRTEQLGFNHKIDC